MKQILPEPAGGQMDADTAGGLTDEGADFEQADVQRFDLEGAPRLG